MRTEERFPRSRRRENVNWDIYDSSFDDYLNDFLKVDTEQKIVRKLNNIWKRPEAVIIDLMASTKAVETLHRKGFKGRLLSVGKEKDSRERYRDFDYYQDISYRKADLATSNGWKEITDWMGDAKADIVMERSYGGLHFVNTDLGFYKIAVNKIWNLLSPDRGLAILQTPPKAELEKKGIEINKWVDILRSEGIYSKFNTHKNTKDSGNDYGILILEKNFNISELPAINSKQLHLASK
jgi:hypothetical protein